MKNKEEEAAGASSSHILGYYLKHKTNEKLIEGLVDNQKFNNSLSEVREGKIKGKTYNLSPRGPVYEEILKKKITKKEDIGGNFEIPGCIQTRGKIEAIDADKDITLVDVKTQVDMDAELQGRIDQDVSDATKDVSAAEPTVFDDEEYDDKEENIDCNAVAEQIQEKHLDNIRKYQSLKRKPVSIAQARKNMIIYLKNMVRYKMKHFRGMTYDKVRPIFKRGYKKVQTLFKPNKDVEKPKKKRVTEETLLQESFKKLKAVEVSGFDSTQETPSNDPKEMSEEDVQNMLEIVPVSEFKVEALQVKYPIIDWEIHSEDADDVLWKLQKYMHYPITWKLYTNCGVHQVSSTTRNHDMFMLIEKDYPLSNGVMTLMLSAKLQVEEDSEMAKDLVMKIFMEANKPKSRSLDTSSK
uniref:Uncharacterized protein n=1 Tax=Tanacetum cinerariifolium TaxID=118510 RepID=A0A6L2P1S3_TANCI|nr:hypothetical protein [Tanacetum cinerariifolium]